MTALDPAQNPYLLGHDAAIRAVEAAYESGRMHHAWLLTGPEGIGKATFAYHIAHYVLSGGQNKIGRISMEAPAARLIASGAHPDLFVLARSLDDKTGVMKNSIPVDEARAMAPHLRLTPTHGDWRVAILDGVDYLNRFGQNAILKMIEEPPPRCLIVMTASSAGMLLPTIRSRCRLLPMAALATEDVKRVIEHVDRKALESLSSAGLNDVLRTASGSAGMALKIIQSDALPVFQDLIALLKTLPHVEVPLLHALGDKMAKKADSEIFDVVSVLFLDIVRRMIKTIALGAQPVAPEEVDLVAIFRPVPIERLFRLWDKLQDLVHKTETANLDKKLTMINAVLELRRCLL